METKVLDRLFDGVDIDQVLEGARSVDLAQRAAVPARRALGDRRPRGPTRPGPQAEKVDYTPPTGTASSHRGRLTDEERELVRANREQASRNRQAQGHPPIDWDDDQGTAPATALARVSEQPEVGRGAGRATSS